jgi:hypothetical protein
MIWAKRRFANAEYAPYLDKLQKLMMVQPTRAQQFIMVSTESGKWAWATTTWACPTKSRYWPLTASPALPRPSCHGKSTSFT